MKVFQGIGTMSGTSLDGLDMVCCTFTVDGDTYDFQIDQVRQVPFDETWENRLRHVLHQSAEVYAKTHVYFGHWLGKTVRQFMDDYQLKPDFVAMHGQTIFHQPEKNFTAQIGDGETIATYLDCPLVTNFRNKDVALGGEGAPLVPLGEQLLLRDHDLFLNMGGFCNISFAGKAFDISPCNIVLNHLYMRADPESELGYDADGEMAASGQLVPELLTALDALPYYHQAFPKSLGWEWVEAEILPLISSHQPAIADALYTFCHHIARQIAHAIEQIGAKDTTMLVTGGGKHNRFLMECMQNHISPLGITIDNSISDDIIDYKEAIVFALLGLRTLTGKPTVLSSVTGARLSSVTGSIHLPPQGGFDLFSARL